LKLTDVAVKTGYSVSTLSKMENDKLSLSYDKLAGISKGLGVDISVFFEQDAAAPLAAPPTGRRSISRAGDGRSIETDAYGHLYMATDLLNKRFIPVIAEIHARSIEEFGDMICHPGEEYAYVLEGVVDLHTELYAPVRLETGDSIYFDSGMKHAYISVGEQPTRVLSICSGEESKLMAAYDKELSVAPQQVEATIRAPEKRAARRARG
jgi:transcriptional regulator with XRE-family HTH domain